MVELRILGTLAILPSGGIGPPLPLTQPKRIALLLYLTLAEPAGAQSRETLMALLWPEADDESARHSLRNALYGLRQALGDDALRTHGDAYVGINPDEIRCDALDVRRLLGEQRWEDALAEWRGDLAPGFHVTGAMEFERWLDEQRSLFRRAITNAAWQRVDELERADDAAVVPAARRAWELDPADEVGARRLLVLLDARVGKTAALRAYDELFHQLQQDFDSEPSPETRALAALLKSRTEPRELNVNAPITVSRAAMISGPSSSVSFSVQSASAVDDAVAIAPRRRAARTAAIAAAIVLVATASLIALRPLTSTVGAQTVDPVTRAEEEGALRLAPKYRQDTSAYAAYMRSARLRLEGEYDASRDTLTALLARNPLYAPGYAGLAHAYLIAVRSGAISPAEGYPKAEAAALKAIALDSAVASAYMALSTVQVAWRWDIRGAGILIERGIALEPHDPEGHILRGNWFKWQREADSALAEYRIAYAVDPLDVSNRDRVARALFLAGRSAEAEAMYRQTLREYPRHADTFTELSDVYLYTGRPREALNSLRSAWAITGDSAALLRTPPAASDSQALRLFADIAHQELDTLENDSRRGEWISAKSFADVHAALHDTAQTLDWLDSMVVQHDFQLCCVRLQPEYGFLRRHPRYKAWEARLPWVMKGAAAVSATP